MIKDNHSAVRSGIFDDAQKPRFWVPLSHVVEFALQTSRTYNNNGYLWYQFAEKRTRGTEKIGHVPTGLKRYGEKPGGALPLRDSSCER